MSQTPAVSLATYNAGLEAMKEELRSLALLCAFLEGFLGLSLERGQVFRMNAQRAIWRQYGHVDKASGRHCAECGGVAHPASGCQYTETFLVCGPCTRKFWKWVREHTNKMPPKRARIKASFYDAAGKWHEDCLPEK